MQTVNILKNLFVVLMLLSFLPTGHAMTTTQLANYSCYNTSHLQIQSSSTETYIQGCAWGCQGGECIDGTALGFNALIALGLVWSIGLTLLFIGRSITPSAETDLTRTAFIFGGFMFLVMGVIVITDYYSDIPYIGQTIANIGGILISYLPRVVIYLAVFYVLRAVIEWLYKAIVEGGYL